MSEKSKARGVFDKVVAGVASTNTYVGGKLLQFVGGLFMEQKGDGGSWVASLGRVAFWVVFGHLMYLWQGAKVPDGSEMSVFYALLGYQGAKIGKDMVTEGAAAWKGGA